jgi:vancomycin resistance protein VanJ
VSASAESQSNAATYSSGFGRWLSRLLVLCAFAYPLVLLAITLALYCVGENWWVTAAALYAPRFLFAIPLPLLAAALWLGGLRRLLWTQAVAGSIALVPLLGFVLPWPHGKKSGAPTLRVLSFNVDSASGGVGRLVDKIFSNSPDVAVLQESPWGSGLTDALRARYPYVESSTQFVVASRFRIVRTNEPPHLPFYGRLRSPRYIRYEIETPLGPLAIYSVHPLSPRGVLHTHQLRAALHELRTGELFAGDPEADMRVNTGLRAFQIKTAADAAAREPIGTLIAGDTNLPSLSASFRESLARYSDGFRSASWGFGYTFPTKHPFLRLDRILANEKLAIVAFAVDCDGVSDHLCVVADVQAK